MIFLKSGRQAKRGGRAVTQAESEEWDKVIAQAEKYHRAYFNDLHFDKRGEFREIPEIFKGTTMPERLETLGIVVEWLRVGKALYRLNKEEFRERMQAFKSLFFERTE